MSLTFLKAKQNSFSNVRCVKLQATDCSVEWKITKRLLHLYLFLIHTYFQRLNLHTAFSKNTGLSGRWFNKSAFIGEQMRQSVRAIF